MTVKLTNALYRAISGGIVDMAPDVFALRLEAVRMEHGAAAEAVNDLGNELFLVGSFELAMACYEWVAKDPAAVGAKTNIGRCEIRLRRFDAAERRARAILSMAPDRAPGWHLLSEALEAQSRYAEAAEALWQAALRSPGDGPLQARLAQVLDGLGRLEPAREAYARALILMPDDAEVLARLVAVKRQLCDWHGLDALSDRLKMLVSSGQAVISPIDFLSEGAGAAHEFACARFYAARWPASRPLEFAATPEAFSASENPPENRLRVGFVSAGFGLHPTAALTLTLFELLRSSAIEAHLFATSVEPDSVERRRFANAAHAFHAVAGLTPAQTADEIRSLRMQVVIDLDGYSRGRAPDIFSYRPSPVQVSWLGYPGTTGAGFFDYVIADRFVLPDAMQRFFSERVVYLSRCYQCTDVARAVAEPPSRQACGLPPRAAIVYVCFNASFKLNHRSFRRMLSILAGVPGSVLWLLKGPERAQERLREAASAAGIAPARLIFMVRLPHADYLSRYRHADLFLDTEQYNAHTSASDALWAGCPVLTRPGDTFATRVAGSLNHHLGMEEMNVDSDAAFVATAIRYGLDEEYRRSVRAKLARRRRESSLFDMRAYADDFAQLLIGLSAHYRSGGLPSEFQRASP